MSFTER